MTPNYNRPPYPGSPAQGRGSPVPPQAMPHPGGMPPQIPGAYYFPPPNMGMGQPMPSNYPYPPQYDPRHNVPVNYMYGGGMVGQPQSPAPNYNVPYTQPGQFPGAQPMSRNGSQVSERPGSSTGQNQPQGQAQGTPQPRTAQLHQGPPVVAQGTQFTKPRKSAAIIIKNANGDPVDLSNLKAPASPAPPNHQSKTPPVASTPTPPPKPSTPKIASTAHTRSDSQATKTSSEIKDELKEKIAKLAAGSKSKEEEDAAKAAAEKAAEEAKIAEEKVKEEKLKAEQKAQAEAKAKEEAEAKAKEEAEAKAKAEAEAAKASEEDEMERIIREMEEEDAIREAEAAAFAAKKKIENEATKAAEAEAAKANAAENDRKMREAEAEAERLEEEKERKRAAAEVSGKTQSVATALANLKLSDKGDGSSAPPTPVETASNKPANLTINKSGAVAGAKVSPGDKRAMKPPPLNLNTKSVEPPQPSAALQSLKTARLLRPLELQDMNYPSGFASPNPALNAAVSKKGTSFKYDPTFLLQFKNVFTEQPSMEFNQQVKSLIGDSDSGSRSASARTPAGGSGRQNSRTGGASGFGAMGSFGNVPGTRTLPPNTTSEQRFSASNQMPRGQQMANPMASFQRPGGAFPGGSMMSRSPSSSNMTPNSPRTGSRANRNASKRDTFNAKAEAQAAKTMPLTQGLRLDPLAVSKTGWKPSSIGQKGGASENSGLMDPSTVQRKVKAALNKMTPENFEKIADQILAIAAQSKEESDGRTLRQVIQLTFEKATDESHWAQMYARFCKRMLETMSPEIRDENIKDKNGQVVSGGALFRKYLLNRCQEDFERGWKTDLPEAPEGSDKKAQEAALLSDEYYKAAAAKRRGLGLVHFIGELFKLGMLTERIMHECVRKLVDFQGTPDEAEVESLSKLLRTIGAHLDATDKGRPMMDVYFGRIQVMMDLVDLPSRLKFMLMDVVDLRDKGWMSKDANKGPKTLDEIRADAEAQAAQKAAEAARSNQRGGGGGRSHIGRGDARQFSSGGYPQQNQNQVGIDDLRRLKGGSNRTSSQNMTLGPTSMFASRSNSGRRLGPGGSLSHRGAEDSGASSRTGTPPTRESHSNNAYSLLANMEDNPASPPSTAASPALSKAKLDSAADKESS